MMMDEKQSKKVIFIQLILPGIIGFIVYLNTLDADFVYDDNRAILSNHDVQSISSWLSLLRNDYWGAPLSHTGSHKSYRPLTVATFRLNFITSGLKPFSYHFVNVLLHAIVCILVTIVVSTFHREAGCWPMLCGILFALHPVHTEAVAGVVGRAELLASAFYLFSLLFYQRIFSIGFSCWTYFAWALLSATASFASKEQGLTVVGCFLLLELLNGLKQQRVANEQNRSQMQRIMILIAYTGILVTIRLWLMGFQPPNFSAADNPTAHESSFQIRFLTFLFLPLVNLQLFLLPNVLSFDWSMESIPQISSVFDLRIFYSFIAYSMIFWFCSFYLRPFIWNFLQSLVRKRKKQPAVDINSNLRDFNDNNIVDTQSTCDDPTSIPAYKLKFKVSDNKNAAADLNPDFEFVCVALALIVLPFIPASNLLFYVGFVVAERILYLPSVGYCMLLTLGIRRLHRICGGNNSTTWQRNFLFASVALLLFAFAFRTWRRNCDWHDEESLYRSGLETNPAKGYANLGNIYAQRNRMELAEHCYKSALKWRPNMADTHYNFGILLQNSNKIGEAIKAYENAISCRPDFALAHLNLGLSLAETGEFVAAEKIYTKCSQLSAERTKDPIRHENAKISCLFNLGKLNFDAGKNEKSIEIFESAVAQLNPHYPAQSLFNLLAESQTKIGRLDEAEKNFRRSISEKFDHVPALIGFAKFLAKIGRRTEAENFFSRAAILSPNDPSVLQQIGQFYLDEKKFEAALLIFLKIFRLNSQNFQIATAIAHVYRQLQKVDEAEFFYRLALNLNKNSSTAFSNLGAMLHLNKKYDEAEEMYLKALDLQPEDTVIEENLRKLRRTKIIHKR